jgi:hypothetical protein
VTPGIEEKVAGAEGIEPPTFGFGDRRSAS